MRRALVPTAALVALVLSLAAILVPARAALADSPVQTVPGVVALESVTCTDPSTCIAVGEAYVGPHPTDSQGVVVPIRDGVPGSPQRVAGTVSLKDVACPSATSCIAVGWVGGNAVGGGTAVVVPITDDVAGSVQQLSGSTQLDSVACVDARTCYAAGRNENRALAPVGQIVTVHDGTAGSTQDIGATAALQGITCRGGSCHAVGKTNYNVVGRDEGALVTIDNGFASYTAGVLGMWDVTAIGCQSDTDCTALGYTDTNPSNAAAVPITSNRPGSINPIPVYFFNDLDCTLSTACEIVGADMSNGAVFGSSHALTSEGRTISGTESLGGVACPNATTCVAVGVNSSGVGVVVTLPPSAGPPVADASVTYTGASTGMFFHKVTMSAKLTDARTGAGIAGQPVDIGRNVLSCRGFTDSQGIATCEVTPNQFAVIGTSTVPVLFPGGGGYGPATENSHTITMLPDTTVVTYTGPTSGDYHRPVTLTATLTDKQDGTAIVNPGPPMHFTFGAQECSASIFVDGTASCTVTPLDSPTNGPYPITASFEGGTFYTSAADTSHSFTINRAPAAVHYTGPDTTVYGEPITLSGTLTDPAGGNAVAGRTVGFDLGSQKCQATTDSAGSASCSVTPTDSPAGSPYPVMVKFAGDDYYTAANDATGSVTITRAPTRLDPSPLLQGGMRARLSQSDTEAPVAGQVVNFTVHGRTWCRSSTNSHGVARCDRLLAFSAALLAGGYHVGFAGTDNYLPSDATATLSTLAVIP